MPSSAYNRAAMQKDNLPLTIDPFRSAGAGLSYSGLLPLAGMKRLLSGLAEQRGDVKVTLDCSVDPEGICCLKGCIETSFNLQCQRCLEFYDYAVSSHFVFGMVRSAAESERLPERYEPWIIEGNLLIISDMIEEELIMSLPVAPMHLPSDCRVQLENYSIKQVDVDLKVENENNPFRSIRSLYSTSDSED